MIDTLLGGKADDAEILWVVMGNDYPAAIWRGTKEQAEVRLASVKEAQKIKDQRELGRVERPYSPRVFWRLHPFKVETLGTPPDTLDAASKMTGIPVPSLRALMHGWAYVHPLVASHQHATRQTWYSRLAEAELQTSRPVVEGEMLTVYIGIDDGKFWVRPQDEFDDGRFLTHNPET